ncbi:hypothetical protein P3342_000709 [Pyrenophora teres f. teres]|uniref:Uncharacterized protein n=1 Tax=Pyrenophora teres f. teres (strain 0-1) TaxID=861557 RepID=E3RND0_PYRTT|nr:hypothetical protein PTT_10070 [Pyrenophora teres f. teres 0-1]KAK1917991.1 hypothetical protein P3342_000709 [Pyrenophora teres f. teres]
MRRRALMKKKSRIYNQVEPRTLRKSARKQLKLERSRSLRISPWMVDPDYRLGQTYPKASLLGLPTELRQRIFYQASGMQELKTRARTVCPTQQHMKNVRRSQEARQRGMDNADTELERYQIKHIMAIRRRVGEFSCVSALIRRDMEYVKRLWLRDLVDYFMLQDEKSKHAIEDAWAIKRNDRSLNLKGKEGKVVKAKQRRASIKRPGKCWRCMERHSTYDAVCPMARHDPERWQKLTKRMGGWRPSVCDTSLFRGTRIVFADD